ncbi:putative Late nodulin [Medicago truncatula]|uniref:Nodule Cysteine-Rich (NCR) secreted peptide n=1 Tax=Medicago truncatula TaxID=3880 RepID=A0A072VAB0_MEDTR|nr:Nodule Cysteine-Rich (NCR) secreted peptide [Medicago truncatula]RHN74836.1 putative Late nodulin [Medicago truncatula]
MAEILKFVYALIIFLSFILAVISEDIENCETHSDCPHYMCTSPETPWCVAYQCGCY